MVLLIDNYDSFVFNLYQLIAGLGRSCQVVRNDKITIADIQKLKPEVIVISPGPGRPEDAGLTQAIIQSFAGVIPIFGVCLGLQAIGQVFGARLIQAPKPLHGKQSLIYHHNQGSFHSMQSPFQAVRYHSLILERASLPDCLQMTAESKEGLVMGIQHKEWMIEGVQFHPESIATEQGFQIVKSFFERIKANEFEIHN